MNQDPTLIGEMTSLGVRFGPRLREKRRADTLSKCRIEELVAMLLVTEQRLAATLEQLEESERKREQLVAKLLAEKKEREELAGQLRQVQSICMDFRFLQSQPAVDNAAELLGKLAVSDIKKSSMWFKDEVLVSQRPEADAPAKYSHNGFLDKCRENRCCTSLIKLLEALWFEAGIRNADKTTALVVAVVASTVCPTFVWPLGHMIQRWVKAKTCSKLVLDVLHSLLQPLPSYKVMWAAENDIAERVLEHEENKQLSPNFDCIVTFDNIQSLHQTARQTVRVRYDVPVSTSMSVFYQVKKNTGIDMLQRKAELSPAQWKPMSECPEDIFFTSEEDNHAIQLHLCELYLEGCDEDWVQRPNRFVKQEKQHRQQKLYSKECSNCGLICDNVVKRKKTCPQCKSKALVEIQADDNQSVKLTKWSRNGGGRKRKSRDEDGIKPSISDSEDNGMKQHSLLPLALNPNSSSHIGFIYDHILQMGKVKGHVPDDQALRSFICCASDEGACVRKELNKRIGLVQIIGTGHEMLNTTKPILRYCATALDMGCVYEILDRKKDGQKQYLFSGKDLHKSDAFLLKVLLTSWWKAICFMAKDSWDKKCTDLPTAVLLWLSQTGNATLRAHAPFFKEILPAYSLMRASVRTSKLRTYLSARKKLQPLLFCSGSNKYGPHLMYDTAGIEHCWPEAVVKFLEDNFSIQGKQKDKGQGYDFMEEQHINAQKKCSSLQSFHSLVFASYYVNANEELDLFDQLGFRDPSTHGRGAEEYELDVDLVTRYFLDFYNYCETVTTPLTFAKIPFQEFKTREASGSKPLHPQCVMEEGITRMKSYVPSFLAGKAPTFPSAIVPQVNFLFQDQGKKEKEMKMQTANNVDNL